jgi:hypothetical protein
VMGWFFAIAAILLAVYSKAFRLLALAVLVVGTVAVFALIQSQNRKSDTARRLIPISDVHIDDARLAGLDRFSGRVRNANRSHTLTSLDLELTIRDCGPSGGCEVVGQTSTSISARVPPGQARDVSDYVGFNPSPHIRGRMEWSYVTKGTTGDN